MALLLLFGVTHGGLFVTNLLPATNANLSVTSDMAVAVAVTHTATRHTDYSTAQHSTLLASTYCNTAI